MDSAQPAILLRHITSEIFEDEKIGVVVGTSIGGMFAQKLRGMPKVLVNPSFFVSKTFRKNMGTVTYFKEREDGVKEFEITPEIVESYAKLEKRQFEREEIMCRIAAEHGCEMGGKAIPMNEGLLNSADLIIVMTNRHREEVTRLLRYDHWNRIVRFNDFCFGEPSDLPDPHFQTEYVYRTCFDTIECGCAEIIKKLNN